MNCEQCKIAERNPASVTINSFCHECQARDLANSPIYAKAAAFRTMTSEYQMALMKIAGEGESVETTHKRVRRWADARTGVQA